MKLHTGRRGDGPLLLCHPGGPGFDGSELHDLGGLDRTRTLLLLDPRGSGRTGRLERASVWDRLSRRDTLDPFARMIAERKDRGFDWDQIIRP